MEQQKKPIRIWVDGCFDMMHFGHANALRQAKTLGDYLIVGVHSDADIEKNKGPPVMKEQERYQAVRACKWVDEVVEGSPYTFDVTYLDKYNCDFVVHGDDVVLNGNGEDCYAAAKKSGRFRTVPRTVGVSTTDIVGRMLLVSREHLQIKNKDPLLSKNESDTSSPYTRASKFVPSSRKIVQFSAGMNEPRATDKVVYVDGGFDLFHVGHISFLKAARQLGDYLIVGIHTDDDINAHKGHNFPIMTLQERVLSVMACRYVSEVIIGAPYAINEAMINNLNIKVVASGSIGCEDPKDSYAVAKKMGIWQQLDSPSKLTSSDVIQRILANFARFSERNKKKEAREVAAMDASAKESPAKKAKTSE